MTRRDRIQQRRRSKKLKTSLVAGAVIVAVFSMIGLIIWREVRPGIGTMITALRADHVKDGDPVESPTDPPTSGSHYGSPMQAGFYTEESPEYLAGDHDGYILHSLEHGYVAFWYNCDLLEDQECETLLSDIQDTMDEFDGKKLIAFPRPSITNPLVMTSWEQLQEFETYDADLAKKFIKVNQPRAPEPNAP
jgi:hypothetical protein